MSTRDLAQKMSSNSSSGQGLFVIQRFIKCKGPNAFVTRAHWRKGKPPQSWVITNKTSFFDARLDEHDKYITDVRKQMGSSIVQNKGGKVSEETCGYVQSIVKFIEKCSGIYFEEMVCDFIK